MCIFVSDWFGLRGEEEGSVGVGDGPVCHDCGGGGGSTCSGQVIVMRLWTRVYRASLY